MSPRPLVLLAVLPAAATAVVYLPPLLTDSDEIAAAPAALVVAWFALLLLAAPLVAAWLNRSLRVALNARRGLVLAGTQLAVAAALVRLDVWLEVRSGYLLANSGEEAMAYGIGGVLSGVVGGALGALVVLGAWAVTRWPGLRRLPVSSVHRPVDGARRPPDGAAT